jgi:uncharacterized protein (TIGR02757 family)
MRRENLKAFLEEKYWQYATPDFLIDDPIQIPHQFAKKEDIEIAGLFAALFAWGQRKTIISKATELMARMDEAPFEFVREASPQDLKQLHGFVHRTFNDEDVTSILLALRSAYQKFGSLERLFINPADTSDLKNGLTQFRQFITENGALPRTLRHLPDPFANSAAKRVNMYLRWMVRTDAVDFGIWKSISPALLSCPLDVHSGRVARSLGLLTRTQNDWRAVEELNTALRKLDPTDPVKYDFSLFGLGVYEGFGH